MRLNDIFGGPTRCRADITDAQFDSNGRHETSHDVCRRRRRRRRRNEFLGQQQQHRQEFAQHRLPAVHWPPSGR